MRQLLTERIKIFLTGLAIAFAIALLSASCTSMRKDCQGRRHKKLSNGIYITALPAVQTGLF